MTELNAFDGLMDWMYLVKFFKENKITKYEVKQNITEIEIDGSTVYIPLSLERIISEILKESTYEPHN